MYAHDEREWLLHIAFNAGVERFAYVCLARSRRLLISTTFQRFRPGGSETMDRDCHSVGWTSAQQ